MSKTASPHLTRRRVFAGAGTAGALAAAAALLPQGPKPAAAAAEGPLAGAAGADGYQLTEHVLRYYQTARV
jgi:hypothetical protein